MTNLDLTDEDRDAIRSILLQWKEEGNPNPLLPAEVDIDGDGIVDSYGLDDENNVITVLGANLEDTVFESTGEEESEDN